MTGLALRRVRKRGGLRFRGLLESLRRRQALLWLRLYRFRLFIQLQIAQHGASARLVLLITLVSAGALLIPFLQRSLATFFTTEQRLQDLRTLFVTVGGALLGGAAIVSSLVLFAMQVNVERMPHGLFRRISTDRRLLCAFAATFLLALLVASLSLLPDPSLMGAAVYAACWSAALILVLFLYVYRRALTLINPLRQLGFVVTGTRREFRAWVRRANRATPLLASQPRKPARGDFLPTPNTIWRGLHSFKRIPVGWKLRNRPFGMPSRSRAAMPNKVITKLAPPR